MSDPRRPSAPPAEQENLYRPPGPDPIIFDGFSTLNTQGSRPGIDDKECFWLDGFMPIGRSYIRTLPGLGPLIYSVVGITTWNPNDKSANLTLSNGNLTATSNSSNPGAVRATTFKASGQHKFECIHQQSATSVSAVGVADGSASEATYIGADAHGWGLMPNGVLFHNGISIVTLGSYNLGDTISVAVDAGAQKA